MNMRCLLVLTTLCVALGVHAEPAPEALNLAQAFLAQAPASLLPTNITFATAVEWQRDLVSALALKLGPVSGYKVGLVSKENQQRMGASGPVLGTFLQKMMMNSPATVPAKFGTRPIAEADFVVVVKDEGLNDASTPMEALAHLSELVAFIELPDVILATNQPMNAAVLTAANVGARLGVLGDRLTLETTPEMFAALGTMIIRLTDASGAELCQNPGSGILGHPMNAVSWLVQELHQRGVRLKKGDLLSLGSPARPQAVKAGDTLKLTYEGIGPKPLRAQVTFQ